ncbi:MAG: GvpL/GvpF family gas vesicle protein [Candidatus Omnitrophica bacterium]|nr:GvpL/GvpF family gas vesicle protein [Candidatus Omnitrophota bacterium]
MKIYAYAIIDSNSEISNSINGLGGAGIYNIPYRDIGIIVSGLSEQIQGITPEHVLKHEEVVERLMENFTVLPMRFLTQFNREEDILLMMKKHYRDFKDNLDRLRNKLEFGVKVIWPGETIKKRIIAAFEKNSAAVSLPERSAIQSFVKEKFEKHKIDKEFQEEADTCIAIIDNFFNKFVMEKKLEKLKSKNLLLSAAYLVEKERQNEFKEAFERARVTLIDLKFLLSGPWAPYNFIVLTKDTDIFREALKESLKESGVI